MKIQERRRDRWRYFTTHADDDDNGDERKLHNEKNTISVHTLGIMIEVGRWGGRAE